MIDADMVKAWEKLTERPIELYYDTGIWVYESGDPLGSVSYEYHKPGWWKPVPDPSAHPEAWLRAFLVSGRSINIRACGDGHLHFHIDHTEWAEYLGWENLGPATEAAIRAWAKAAVR